MLEVQANGFGPAVLSYGGDTFNTAVYLRRCSAAQAIQVGYATGLGDDPLSHKLIQEWSALGLNLQHTRQITGRLPGMYLIETDDKGERHFHFWRENSAARHYFDVEASPLEADVDVIDCFYFSGISLAILNTQARQRLFKLLAQQKAKGKQVVFDNNYRPRLWPDKLTTQQVFNEAFSVSTIAMITADDHKDVYDFNSLEEAVAHAQSLSVEEIVIKRGANPTLVRAKHSNQWENAPTQPVVKVVDTTAAGDSFAAGYLSKRLLGASSLIAADFGNRVAAKVVQHRGAIIPLDAMKELM
ncbi:MAG: 2-dehydro-3-deoxygluconokinase [Pseudomonadota bacterium]|jgi:2-dehydro-3-deoxygluconokinase